MKTPTIKATKIHTKILMIIAVIITIIAIFLIYFSENIYGYYKFKEICKKEAGLHVFEKLEKNVGWEVDGNSKSYAQSAAGEFVDFVRYKDKNDGLLYDMKYIGGRRNSDESFKISPADQDKTPIYQWRVINERIPNQLRLSRSGYEILSSNNDRILISFYGFGYSEFDQSKTILGAPSGVYCGDTSFWTAETISRIFN